MSTLPLLASLTSLTRATARAREMTTVLTWTQAVGLLLEESVACGDADACLAGLDIHLLSLDLVRSLLSRRLYK